jgi:hypothetical protein
VAVPAITHLNRQDGDVDIYVNGVLTALVRQSAALGGLGLNEKGLYSAISLKRGDCLANPGGRYSGFIVGPAGAPLTRAAISAMQAIGKGAYLLDLKVGQARWVVDGSKPPQSEGEQRRLFGCVVLDSRICAWPGLHTHIMNDPRGTGRTANAFIKLSGRMEALRDVKPYNRNKPPTENIASELLWDYHSEFMICVRAS